MDEGWVGGGGRREEGLTHLSRAKLPSGVDLCSREMTGGRRGVWDVGQPVEYTTRPGRLVGVTTGTGEGDGNKWEITEGHYLVLSEDGRVGGTYLEEGRRSS